MIKVVLYTREGCELCDVALSQLEELQEEFPHRLLQVDIESDPALLKKYLELIPVVEIGPYTLKAPFEKIDLKIALASAQQGQPDPPQPTASNRGWALRLNRAAHFFTRHWLAAVNFLVLLYVGLPFTAPALMKAGATGPANAIFKLYSPLCHQLAYRSWFLFGEQIAYPRELAGLGWTSLEEATGVDEDNLWASRDFLGNESVGYKVALCQRDVAIYGGILLAGLVFAGVRKWIKPLPVWAWLLIGIVPIAVDGGSQLLSAIPIGAFPARESTPLLRSLTGMLFGVTNVWLAYPHVEESMQDMRAILAAKLAAADQEPASTVASV
jgi:uncharacterized membrane protein